MAGKNIISKILHGIFRIFLSVDENPSLDIGTPKNILIVRQHNQLGDLLAGVSLFRALKEKFPECRITLIASVFNYPGVVKNKFIDEIFIFNKKELINPEYFSEFMKLLKKDYDIVVVPVVVSISFTSNFISRIAKAKIRIGAKSLDGKPNESEYFFDRRVNIDWRKHPDSNVYERSLDIVRPFGVNTNNYRSEISFDEEDKAVAGKFIASLNLNKNDRLIGLHVGAGKSANRWSLEKYIMLIEKINQNFPAKFYVTGSSSDKDEVEFVKEGTSIRVGTFINKKITELSALISISDLFVSNDTGIMHVAGTTDTPQVSIFGPTNPFNWGPIGQNKLFVRKSELIDEVELDDVYTLCEKFLTLQKEERSIA
jgi:ADP-heptose:LPS heptosyltransferase